VVEPPFSFPQEKSINIKIRQRWGIDGKRFMMFLLLQIIRLN